MQEQLQWIVQNGRPWAAQRAHIALQVSEGLRTGALTQDEANEVLADLVRTDKLDEECDDLEMKTMLVTAIYAVAKVV